MSPLNVLIHVPKTAGTALNSSLKSLKLPGKSHCEAFIDNAVTLPSIIDGIDWISGHVPLARMSTALEAATERPLRYFATVRNPAAQVASHYNWLIEIYHREPAFYNGHPVNIRAISKQIRETDNSVPANIIANLSAYPGLFFNVQARYLGFGKNTGSLTAFDYVATEDTVETMLNLISGSDAKLVRDNVSPYHFDRAVFESDEMRNFMEKKNAEDTKLYEAIKKRWASTAHS